MATPKKITAEYFPHYAAQGKTIFVLKHLFGSDGFSFWYQLLENLCSAKGHFLDLSIPGEFEFMLAKMKIDFLVGEKILDKLIERGKCDHKLWKCDRIIWCQNLVDNLSWLYERRKTKIEKPDCKHKFCNCLQKHENCLHKPDNCVHDDGFVHTFSPEVKESKVKESKVNKNTLRSDERCSFSYPDDFQKIWDYYPVKKNKSKAFNEFKKLKISNGTVLELINKIQKQITHKSECDLNKIFCPEFPYLERWFKNRKWEDETKTMEEIQADDRRAAEDAFERQNIERERAKKIL